MRSLFFENIVKQKNNNKSFYKEKNSIFAANFFRKKNKASADAYY